MLCIRGPMRTSAHSTRVGAGDTRLLAASVYGIFWPGVRPGRRLLNNLPSNDRANLVEEQPLVRFDGKRFCPIHIGQTLQDRYRIITKLGYGGFATAWLARDHKTNEYAALKISVADERHEVSSEIFNEIRTLILIGEHDLHEAQPTFARLAEACFHIDGPTGCHTCIVMKPKGCSLWTLQRMFDKRQMPIELVSDYVKRLIICVNWLHCVCDVMHGDIRTTNVLSEVSSAAIFERLEREEKEDPGRPIYEDDYPIYPTRGHPTSIFELSSEPVLTDFGTAKSAEATHRGWFMADTYRAPEILLGLPWSCEIDVWSIGVLALELLEGKAIFDPIDKVTGDYIWDQAVAQYIAVLGSPPLHVLKKSENANIWQFFNSEGEWKSSVPIPDLSLEDFVTAIPPGEEKTKFINFIRRIFTWDPAERVYSAHLFCDEWLMPGGLPPGAKGEANG